ncbi:MAG: patatin-like phospholipase family protein [Rhizobiaceae bacterium]
MAKNSEELNVLVLQGGGALGAYQAGAYEALAEEGFMPDWVAGISIGAINGALISGNKPEERVTKLRAFWEKVSSGLQGKIPAFEAFVRPYFNEASASLAASFGIPGFFVPRFPSPYFQPKGTSEAISLYDTSPLSRTLEELVDFEYLQENGPRLSVGAVDVKLGNFKYFDSAKQKIGPKHIMASGALPPAFAPVEVDGNFYWDGGIVSNTPIDYVMEYDGARRDMCIFQVDVFRARGEIPRTLGEVTEREKDIRYSSRTRFNSDYIKKMQEMSNAAARLAAKLPPELCDDPDAKLLQSWGAQANITIAHLIRHDTGVDSGTKDYEFSRLSIEEHWNTGRENTLKGLKSKAWVEREMSGAGVRVFDLNR